MLHRNPDFNHLPKFRAIYKDDPWPGDYGAPYRQMPMDWIENFPISDLAADDAWLFMWVTNNTLHAGYHLMEKYGFKPIAPISFIKMRLGMGSVLRHSTEHLLVGRRGKIKPKHRSQGTWEVFHNAAHSVKPLSTYALIEKFTDGPYLELFSRNAPMTTGTTGSWTVWGDEAANVGIEIPGHPIPESCYAPDAIRMPSKRSVALAA